MDIDQLLGSNTSRFSKDSIPILENYVEYQVKENQYKMEANLALLKLYQFYPESLKEHIVQKVLCKGLMNLPNTDFTAYLHILPHNKGTQALVKLHNVLETANFNDFWNMPEREAFSKDIPGFDDAIRNYISLVIQDTHSTIPITFLQTAMDIDQSQLESLANRYHWSVNGNKVSLKSQRVRELSPPVDKISFDGLYRVVRGVC